MSTRTTTTTEYLKACKFVALPAKMPGPLVNVLELRWKSNVKSDNTMCAWNDDLSRLNSRAGYYCVSHVSTTTPGCVVSLTAPLKEYFQTRKPAINPEGGKNLCYLDKPQKNYCRTKNA
ncbi:uncharacterized protein L3040_003783 [Drepanopeziza brunnea f. sp. 'multigermtubi']|uniref:uncharacterized protein n=1 Tax=Drepanopeziza brunnea f. sp. 'multigermtubi' TaxID=698441 RepID=UPI0023A23D6B|nr:hypothetical protein L3040_003783 [Drepanopeziza brunnea f. sp. 'multigermtubi']